MDRRLTPATNRIALTRLKGRIDAPAFTDGEKAMIAAGLVDLCATPGGARDRQLIHGAIVTVIDRRDGFAFLTAEHDGYCGWVPEAALGVFVRPTHWVASPGTHAYAAPKVQADVLQALPMLALLAVDGIEGAWAKTGAGFVPLAHLKADGDGHADPVTVAESLLGSPYLWGGNSRAGIDCSGLVQLAHLACGQPCPADSDLQQTMGGAVADIGSLMRGDLVFWRGHVGMMSDAVTLLHANAYAMAVAAEPLATAIARIAASGGGSVTALRRP